MRLCKYFNSIGRKCDFENCLEFAEFMVMNDLFVSYYCDEHKPSVDRIEYETEIKTDFNKMKMFRMSTKVDFYKEAENTFRKAYFALKKGKKLKFRVLITQEDKIYLAQFRMLPWITAEGKSEKEVIKNIRDELNKYLNKLKKSAKKSALPIEEKIMEIVK
ncbi:hypothetical protein HYT58_00785 [Candidatus Woesearchaeota archaeon]|nr:hypothetical protein [Candidatus Woesearchaeota archaeon]